MLIICRYFTEKGKSCAALVPESGALGDTVYVGTAENCNEHLGMAVLCEQNYCKCLSKCMQFVFVSLYVCVFICLLHSLLVVVRGLVVRTCRIPTVVDQGSRLD